MTSTFQILLARPLRAGLSADSSPPAIRLESDGSCCGNARHHRRTAAFRGRPGKPNDTGRQPPLSSGRSVRRPPAPGAQSALGAGCAPFSTAAAFRAGVLLCVNLVECLRCLPRVAYRRSKSRRQCSG
ncbi:hypothetical protein [Hymenobacter terrenus]|uniref:hypothetical protein n=1 Tax=Hymenobacter terrenus TaxID=1629124 RepID=UPI0012DFF5E6|nr:hypothetical protein [Hymenobacter terrenus]